MQTLVHHLIIVTSLPVTSQTMLARIWLMTGIRGCSRRSTIHLGEFIRVFRMATCGLRQQQRQFAT